MVGLTNLICLCVEGRAFVYIVLVWLVLLQTLLLPVGLKME